MYVKVTLFFRHLTKLFDSIAKLKFIESEKAGEKMASGMIAKDGELVPFHGQCDCTGPVSSYLLMTNFKLTITYFHSNFRWKYG